MTEAGRGTVVRVVGRLTLALGLAATAVVLIAGTAVGAFYWTQVRPVRARLHEVRWATDTARLQAGMGELWAAEQLHLSPGDSDVNVPTAALPLAIAELRPTFVSVSRGQVRCELGGAECHYGFEYVHDADALDPREREASSRGVFPAEEVRPGLWCYAEWGLPAR